MRWVKRRQFLVRSLALALLAGTRVEAQPRIYRLAYLVSSSTAANAHLRKALFGRLEELGYVPSRTPA